MAWGRLHRPGTWERSGSAAQLQWICSRCRPRSLQRALRELQTNNVGISSCLLTLLRLASIGDLSTADAPLCDVKSCGPTTGREEGTKPLGCRDPQDAIRGKAGKTIVGPETAIALLENLAGRNAPRYREGERMVARAAEVPIDCPVAPTRPD